MSIKLRITIWADVHRSSSTFSCWKMATIEICLVSVETWIRPVLNASTTTQCLLVAGINNGVLCHLLQVFLLAAVSNSNWGVYRLSLNLQLKPAHCLRHILTASALPSSTAHFPNLWPWGTAWSFCRGCVWLRPGWSQRYASVWGRTRQPSSSRKGYCRHQQHVGMKWKVRMDVTKTHIYHTYKYFKFKFKYIFKIKKNPKDKNA